MDSGGGLIDRLALHPTTEEGREKRVQALCQVNELSEVIRSTAYFSNDYTAAQQTQVLKGNWRVGWSWGGHAVVAGFHKRYFDDVYSHYCGYAHSSFISAIQVRDSAGSLSDQYMLARTAIQTGVHILAHFLFFYAGILNAPKNIFESSGTAYAIARIWHFDAEEMDFLYKNSEGE